MSTDTSLTNNLSNLSLGHGDIQSPSLLTTGRWSHAPISSLKHDIYSRFVMFDGKEEPYIEPHFVPTCTSPGRDPDFDALVQARWHEYLAEGYLKTTGKKANAFGGASNETKVNTPVQLYLVYRRLARAQLETSIYSKILEKELDPSLRGKFEDLTSHSLPQGGVFKGASEVSPL